MGNGHDESQCGVDQYRMSDGMRRRPKGSGSSSPAKALKRERSRSEAFRDQWVVSDDGRLFWDPAVELRWTEARERALRIGLSPDAPDEKRATVFVTVYSRDMVVYGSIIALTTIIGTILSSLVFEGQDLQGLIYPYISETARDMPQTGAFGFGMTISSMFMIFCAVLQYGKVKRDLGHTTRGSKRNFTAVILGVIAPPFLGLLAVYDTKRALTTHRVCVVVFFSLTMIYMVLVLNIYELLAGGTRLVSQLGGDLTGKTGDNLRNNSGGCDGGDGIKADSDGENLSMRRKRSKYCRQHKRQQRCSTAPTFKQLQNVRFSLKAKRIIAIFFFTVTVLYLPVGIYLCSDAYTDDYLEVDVYIHAGRAVCQHLAVISIILFYGTFYYDFGELNLNLVINKE